MTIWPKEVRADLRHGLLSSMKNEQFTASQYLSRAWETAKKLPTDAFGHDPFLKTTGIAIALAGVYEADSKLQLAYQTYADALNHMQEGSDKTSRLRPGLSHAERMRAVALSHKLGEMAEELGKPKEEEEQWLVWSVETVLRDIMGSAPAVIESAAKMTEKDKENAVLIVDELKLPKWVVKHDLAAPFEALGSFYSRAGNVRYALLSPLMVDV